MKKHRFESWVWLAIGIFFVVMLGVLFLVVGIVIPNRTTEDENVGIAQMDIRLNNTCLEEIKKGDKNVWYDGNEIELRSGNNKDSLYKVRISGRGNSTWDQEKKPFSIKLDNKKDILGLGKSKKWTLLANYFDDTHLRNEVAFEFWNMMEKTMQMHEEPVELYIDGEWEGLYYITRKIEISKNMVDIRDFNGVIVELDNMNNKEKRCYYTQSNNCLTVRDLVVEENEKIAMDVFLKKFNAFEKAAEEKNWKRLRELCDVSSMVKYFLIAEFSADPDAYTSSYYFYSDGEKDMIHAGPIWDYDFAFANERWVWGSGLDNSPENNLPMEENAFGFNYYDEDSGYHKEIEANTNISKMFYWMIEIPEFRDAVRVEIEKDLMGKREDLINKIMTKAKLIQDVARRNNEKWGRNDYDGEVEKLLNWITKRYDFIEEEYGAINNDNDNSGS